MLHAYAWTVLSPTHGLLNHRNVNLFHRHHGLEGTFGHVTAASEGIRQHLRGDLPRHAPFIFAPAALAFLSTVIDDRVPVAVGFGLVIG